MPIEFLHPEERELISVLHAVSKMKEEKKDGRNE